MALSYFFPFLIQKSFLCWTVERSGGSAGVSRPSGQQKKLFPLHVFFLFGLTRLFSLGWLVGWLHFMLLLSLDSIILKNTFAVVVSSASELLIFLAVCGVTIAKLTCDL